MTTVTGKHREILIDLLIHYLDNTRERLCIIGNIKKRNSDGDWYINHYIDKWDKRTNYYEPQNNNPEHNDGNNNDDNGQT